MTLLIILCLDIPVILFIFATTHRGGLIEDQLVNEDCTAGKWQKWNLYSMYHISNPMFSIKTLFYFTSPHTAPLIC